MRSFHYDSKMNCSRLKIVIVINTPSPSDYPIWAEDYGAATKNLKEIQEMIAKSKPNVPCQYFLDLKAGTIPTIRFTHTLWEKKLNMYKIHLHHNSSYGATVHP